MASFTTNSSENATRRHASSPLVAVVDAPGGGYVETPDIEERVLGADADVRLAIVPDSHRDQLPDMGADYVILWHRVSLDAAFFERAAGCRAVVCASVGYDHVDLAAARAAGIPIYHVPHYGSEEVADHTIALYLALARNLSELRDHVRDGGWDWRTIGEAPRLRGARWGVIGLGRIGLAVASRARAFGMRIAFYDPYNHPGIEKALAVERVYSVEDLLADSDVVSVHVPLDDSTRHMLDAERLHRMKQGASLINTARGAVIEVAALKEALAEERPRFLGLDVVEGEPEVPRWLREHPRVLITPHAAFYSVDSLAELRTRAARAVLDMLRGARVTSAIAVD